MRAYLFLALWLMFAFGLSAQVFRVDPQAPPALMSDVQKVDMDAEIVAPADYTRDGDRFEVRSTGAVTGRGIWARVIEDWIGPVTPPPPEPLPQVGPQEIRVFETNGDVEMILPTQSDKKVTLATGEQVPNGAMIVTGKEGMCAVLLGGVHSVRLLPQSRAWLQYFKTDSGYEAHIGLEAGGAFVKGGPDVVHPLKVLAGYGDIRVENADFYVEKAHKGVSMALVHGKTHVRMNNADSPLTLTGAWEHGPQMFHYPDPGNIIKTMNANSEMLSRILAAVRAGNKRIYALRERMGKGESLTASEQEYLRKVPRLVYLVRLSADAK